jgi:hypothetical protein
MSAARTAVVVLLVLVLAVNIFAANAAVAADRTVLNPDFVTTSLEEEDAYQELEAIIVDQFEGGDLAASDEESAPLPVDPEAVLAEAVDTEYVKSQVEPNIERTYAYLHGNSNELELVINLAPAKTAIADAVEAELRSASPTELMETVADQTEESSVEAGGTTIDLETVGQMAEDEAVFRAERQALREDIRERIVTTAVDQAFEEASNDELLALVIDDYDPEDYDDQEKEQLVQDNEAEIRAALRDRIEAERDDEIDAAVDDQLAETRETVRSEIRSEFDGSPEELDPALAEPIQTLLLVAADGYLADISHDEFSAEFETASDDLAAGVATVLETQLDEEVPDEIDLTEDMEAQALQNLEQAREVVGLIDLLSIVLPLVGLGLIGGLFLVTKSAATTAIGAGVGLVVGGIPALVGGAYIPRLLQDAMADAPGPMAELVPALASQVADAVFLQSAVVVGLGVVVLGGGLALHFELVEWPDDDDEE